MLGVHINPLLDFREHCMHIAKSVRKLAKALTKRKPSPPYKTLVGEQLLQYKYHAPHLGVLNDRQLATIYGILNKAMRQAIGLLPNFPTEGVQRPLEELGLGLPSTRERATQMGVEHLVTTMNTDTERGYLADAHTLRLLNQFGH